MHKFFAYDPDDSDDVRAEKFAIFLVSASCCAAGLLWTAMYYYVFGLVLTTALPFIFALLVGLSLIVSNATRNHYYAIYTQIACIIYITTFIQWSIGGVFDSGFVLVWAFCGPVIALMFFSIGKSAIWLALYLLNIVVTVVFEDFFVAHGRSTSEDVRVFFVLMNLGFSSVVVFMFAGSFVRSMIGERMKANRLLLNILPDKIARTLKSETGIIAEKYDNASIMFADIVDYSEYSRGRSPDEIVSKLNEIFLIFDDLVEAYGLEKIKTIGDAYMVAGGLLESRADHTRAMAMLALDMLEGIRKVRKDDGSGFSLRIGIHAGPVVAGVIGRSKFAYDLWGDAVNVASRLESGGADNRIHVSGAVRDVLKDDFRFDGRGRVEMKGVGEMETYFLIGRAAEGAASHWPG